MKRAAILLCLLLLTGCGSDAVPAIASASEDAPADDPETTTVDATIDATTNPSREIAPEPHHD